MAYSLKKFARKGQRTEAGDPIRRAPGCLLLLFLFWAQASCSLASDAYLTVTGSAQGTLTYGIGWNMAGQVPRDNASREIWYQFLQWSGCQLCRLHWSYKLLEPENDNNDPWSYNWSGFSLKNPEMADRIDRANALEKLGIDYWFCGWDAGGYWQDCWMGKAKQLPANADEVGECQAALVHLMKQDGAHPHFRGISVQNEPDIIFKRADGSDLWYPADAFWAQIVSTDAHLKKLGERKSIEIVGPETCGPVVAKKFSHVEMLRKYGPILDGVGDHLYSWFYKGFDYADPEKCIGNTALPYYAKLKSDLRSLYGREVPVFVGEYSCRIGSENAKLTPEEIYDDNLCNAELLIRLMNVGVGGFLQWWFADNTVGPWDNREPQLNAMTRDAQNRLVPQASVYYPHAALARYVGRGWQMLGQNVTGGRDAKSIQRIFAAALRDPKSGHLTLLVVNDDFAPQRLLLSLEDAKAGRVLHRLFVKGPVPEGLRQEKDLLLTAGRGELQVPARSITALTTMDVGDLALPQRLSVKPLPKN